MKASLVLLLGLLTTGSGFFCPPVGAAEPPPPDLAHRWVYLATNLAVDKNVDDAVALLERAARAGYNGLVLHDSKFLRTQRQDAKSASGRQRPPMHRNFAPDRSGQAHVRLVGHV